jgi:3-dehydroquinate synthase
LLGLPAYVSELDRYLRNRTDARCILRGLEEFREHLGGRLTVTLLRGIGDGIEANKLDECRIVESIALLREHQAYQVGGEWHEHAYRYVSADATATY